jgi:hypothetical protein
VQVLVQFPPFDYMQYNPDWKSLPMSRIESEQKKFFRMDPGKTPVCLLHGLPNCKGCTEVYVAVVLRQILRRVRQKAC